MGTRTDAFRCFVCDKGTDELDETKVDLYHKALFGRDVCGGCFAFMKDLYREGALPLMNKKAPLNRRGGSEGQLKKNIISV